MLKKVDIMVSPDHFRLEDVFGYWRASLRVMFVEVQPSKSDLSTRRLRERIARLLDTV